MARKMLGLAFGPRSLLAVEISADGKSVELLKRGEFEITAPEKAHASADAKAAAQKAGVSAQEAGKKFAEFLKSNGFTAKQACIGLPTQWLMLKEKTLPQVGAENLAGMLTLQAERDFSLEPSQLILDYSFAPQSDSAGKAGLSILLAAALRERVDFCVTMAQAAGLNVKLATSSAFELGQAAGANALIHAGAFGVDLIVRNTAGVFVPAVLSSTTRPEDATAAAAWAGGVGMEARRVLGMRAGQNGADEGSSAVALWNGARLESREVKALAEKLGRGVQPLESLKGSPLQNLTEASRFVGAAVVALRGLEAEPAPLNFLDSKLVEKTPGRFAGVKGWMTVAAALAFVLLAALIYSWISNSSELATLKKQAAARKAEVDGAKVFLTRYASAQGWYDKRPNILECMKALTRVIPVEGGSAPAWIANLSVKEDFHCTVAMKAVDNKAAFEVFNAIENDDSFREVKLVYMTQPDKKKSEMSFAVSFVYWKQ